jgi:hypothetical protein
LKQTGRFQLLDASIQDAIVRFCDSQSTALDLVLDRNTRRILDHIDEIQKKQIETESQKDIDERKRKILKSLVHGSPFTRENDILSKHDGTFEWIFDEGPETGSTFLSWLRSDGGIFWIQGKPGSGKSTLMKFLCTSTDRIAKCIDGSGTGKTYVFFSFYFWLADGTKLQNTERGFLCSLLCQLLDTIWILDSSYLTDDRLRQKQTQGNWDLAELRSLVFLAADTLLAEHSLCVFVDALDECQAEDLVRVLSLIKQLSTRGIKICASSRPEQRIVNKLQPDASEILKVDLYTRNDIARFVNDEFQAINPGIGTLAPSKLEYLAQQIINDADGVFLWASLVARDVCKGIENGDNFRQLRQRADQTPGDLDSLYKNMLSRVGPDQNLYMAEAGCYFNLVLHFESSKPMCFGLKDDLPLIHCLSVYKKYQQSITPDQAHDLDMLLPHVESRINVVCAGMLVCGTPYGAIDSTTRYRTARFVHRTARDFFLESGNKTLPLSSLALVDFFTSATLGFLMVCGFYGLPSGEVCLHCIAAIQDLTDSRLKPEQKLRLLLLIDKSMRGISRAKHWLYKHLLNEGLWIDGLDFLGMAIYYGFSRGLLTCILENGGASFSRRYKTYLLLLACIYADSCPRGIQRLLSLGADPNQAMFSARAQADPGFRFKTSPWLQYLANCSRRGGHIDPDVVEAFLKHGAKFEELILCRACISADSRDLDPRWGTFPKRSRINLVLQANARYVLEANLEAAHQPRLATDLPSAYCKVLGFVSYAEISSATDAVSSRSSRSSSLDKEDYAVSSAKLQEDFQLYLVDHELLSNTHESSMAGGSQFPKPQSALQRLICDIQRSLSAQISDLQSVHDELSVYLQKASSESLTDWALENGCVIQDPEPASLFADYERFRGDDGSIDLDALFAD